MGFLTFFTRAKKALPMRLPLGSFTVDREGAITASTLPRSFPLDCARAISDSVVATFRQAHESRLPLVEFNVSYPGLKIVARDLGGGAIVFLLPRAMGQH